jgi:hypothetical protein
MRWASYWLIYITIGSIVVSKWSYSPHLSSRHGSLNKMWATGIMKQLIYATSDVLAWLPNCLNQMWATGIMKQLLYATSVVLAWLLQSDGSNRYHEDTGEWSSPPRLLSRHGCPNQTWATGTNGQLLCLNKWIFTDTSLRSCVRGSLLSRKTVHCITLIILHVLFYLI